MDRINIYITKEQHEFLQSLTNKTLSEHIRRAIDNYIQQFTQKPSTSPSIYKPITGEQPMFPKVFRDILDKKGGK